MYTRYKTHVYTVLVFWSDNMRHSRERWSAWQLVHPPLSTVAPLSLPVASMFRRRFRRPFTSQLAFRTLAPSSSPPPPTSAMCPPRPNLFVCPPPPRTIFRALARNKRCLRKSTRVVTYAAGRDDSAAGPLTCWSASATTARTPLAGTWTGAAARAISASAGPGRATAWGSE